MSNVCTPCQRGEHTAHDRYASDGSDAGCANQGIPGNPHVGCDCAVIAHTARSTRNGAHCATCTCADRKGGT